jgi:hypothetical protein
VTRVPGPSLEQLDQLGDGMAALMARALAEAAGDVQLSSPPGPGDLAALRQAWDARVEATLLPALAVGWQAGAAVVRVGLRDALGLTAAAWTDVPPTQDALAEAYLEQARNRLARVGDDLWETAREELLEGMRQGEGVDELAARLQRSAGLTEARASLVARSEVNGAANAGALAQVRAAGVTGSKSWLAAHDLRVRAEHREADEQTVPIGEHFTVGGFPADRPHDPTLPPHLSCNCRCAMSFEIDAEAIALAPPPEREREPTAEQVAAVEDDRGWLRRLFDLGLEAFLALLGRETATTASGSLPAASASDEPGGDTMTDTLAEPEAPETEALPEHWHAVMATEGVSTGLRTFAEGAITWREPPFALMWQKMTPESGGHALAVQVGLVARVERRGAEIHGWGPLDLGSEDGAEYARRLVEGFARWGSVSPDENKVDVELVMPDGDELGAEPEQVIFHSFNIAEFTSLSVPALADATIEATPALLEALGMQADHQPMLPPKALAAAVADLEALPPKTKLPERLSEVYAETFADGGTWDGPAAMSRCAGSDDPAACYNSICAGKKAGDPATQDAHALPHHETPGGPPHPGGVRSALQMLPKTKGLTNAEAAQRHLQAHLNAINASAVTAAAHTITIPDIPPASWFEEPSEEPAIGAVTVTDQGRVFGYLAPAGVAHVGHRRNGQLTYAPAGTVDYGKFMNKPAFVDAGEGGIEQIPAGNVTMGCGHAPIRRSDPYQAAEHYDNSCSVVARIRVGENQHGTWVAGALLPDVTAEQVGRMFACQLSGDWQAHEHKAGWTELVAALLVPVPGFPKAQQASVRVREGQLVASAVPVRHGECGCTAAAGRVSGANGSVPSDGPASPDLRQVVERLAASVGLDLASRQAQLAERVRAGRS